MSDIMRNAKSKVKHRAMAAAGADEEEAETGYALVQGQSADDVSRKLLYGDINDPELLEEVIESSAIATEGLVMAMTLAMQSNGSPSTIMQSMMLILVQQFMLGFEVGKNLDSET